MKKTAIHIGANKAASTTLQRALFRNHSGLHYLGEDAIKYQDYRDIVNSMISDDDFHFPVDACSELFASNIEQFSDKTLLYSNEDIMTSRVPVLCAQRLKKFLPNSEIILIVRNQMNAVPSFYVNHGAFLKPVPPTYFRRHVSFDDWMQFNLMFIKYGALASYFYNRFISVYAELFGREHTHIFLFEEFVEDKKTFTDKLCHVLEIDSEEANMLLNDRQERQSITNRTLVYNSIRTRLFWNKSFTKYLPGRDILVSALQRFLESGPQANININQQWSQKIHELYAEENSALALSYNLPLKKYGYPVV